MLRHADKIVLGLILAIILFAVAILSCKKTTDVELPPLPTPIVPDLGTVTLPDAGLLDDLGLSLPDLSLVDEGASLGLDAL